MQLSVLGELLSKESMSGRRGETTAMRMIVDWG